MQGCEIDKLKLTPPSNSLSFFFFFFLFFFVFFFSPSSRFPCQDVDGIYSAPPSEGGRLLDRYYPNIDPAGGIIFGQGSKVGRGGMAAKVQSATWAWNKGSAVVVANGNRINVIPDIIAGKRIGTFLSDQVTCHRDMGMDCWRGFLISQHLPAARRRGEARRPSILRSRRGPAPWSCRS
jgi:hypothetical protein